MVEQRHLDLTGLGLVAAGVFLAFPLFLGWEGGAAGEALIRFMTGLVGDIAYSAPVALVAAGALLVMRPVLPALRPFRSGGLCLFVSALLGFGAGGEPLSEHGGVIGHALHQVASGAFSDVGASIIAIFLAIAGGLLLTGGSVAGVLSATHTHVTDTTRALRRPRDSRPSRPGDDWPERPPESTPYEPAFGPPEQHGAEFVVRPGARGDQLDGALRYPDLFGTPAEGAVAPPPRPEPPLDDPLDDPLEDIAEAPEVAPRFEPEPEPDLDPEPPVQPPVEPIGRSARAKDGREQMDLELPVAEHDFALPDPRILKRSTPEQIRPDTAGQEQTATRLVEALGHLGVQAQVIGAVAGPHITRYELQLAPGVKMAKVSNLKNDLAYALAATDIRILAPIPGKRAVGVEVPNRHRRIVTLGDVHGEPPAGSSPLTVWLGKDVSGKAIHADLAKMPHILVAGTTGAGKSGAVNAMLSSILLRATPEEVRFVLVDPKQVELNHYEAIPHLLTPVITSPRMAANALQNLVREMEWRYGVMSVKRTRSLVELNKARVAEGDPALPYILCVIDELADLMMVAPADVEDSIIRLAQKARAVGIHLVLATQSPRVDVITGMIKANVPSRIAFSVSSQTDSRVILDQNGAESLLGQGDMLFSPVGSSRLQRIQGAYIDEPQIAALTSFWARQGEPELREDLLDEVQPEVVDKGDGGDDGFDPDEDPLLGDAIQLVVEMGTASTSMLQRRLRLGYTRAGRLIDMLERRGIISGYEGSKPRQVLVTEGDLPRVLAALEATASAEPAPVPVPVPDDPEPA
ncbi:MAG: segregation ATPase FtsK/SpoIIIE, family [Solirubrobacteraceae bacterium]|nr:segregation ATPase FtsK/SpoIIIE, family [Solirubrobacteraceae bacterium]